MLDILLTIPGKKRATSSGWHVFNGICCHHRGHNPDRRARAGIKFAGGSDWSYSCFNCGFKCGYVYGKSFTLNLKQLLVWCGLDREEVERLSFQSFSQRDGVERFLTKETAKPLHFEDVELPSGARAIDPAVDQYHIDYLAGRGLKHSTYNFMVVDGEARHRLIIPYYWKGRVVGHTSRYYDSKNPKYVTKSQRGYVFGVDYQDRDWGIAILVEGQFDALSIGGCAIGGSNITDEQATTIKSLNRRIIFVPDRDKAGLAACGRALELGYQVSLPNWGSGIKDVNDAVRNYGKLPALLSIIEAATSSKVIVEMKRKKLL